MFKHLQEEWETLSSAKAKVWLTQTHVSLKGLERLLLDR